MQIRTEDHRLKPVPLGRFFSDAGFRSDPDRGSLAEDGALASARILERKSARRLADWRPGSRDSRCARWRWLHIDGDDRRRSLQDRFQSVDCRLKNQRMRTQRVESRNSTNLGILNPMRGRMRIQARRRARWSSRTPGKKSSWPWVVFLAGSREHFSCPNELQREFDQPRPRDLKNLQPADKSCWIFF